MAPERIQKNFLPPGTILEQYLIRKCFKENNRVK